MALVPTKKPDVIVTGSIFGRPEHTNDLTLIVTDGHRLTRNEFNAPDGSQAMPDAGVIIPSKAIKELLRLLSKKLLRTCLGYCG